MPDAPLSALQQFILALAYFHRLNEHRDEGTHPDVYAYEVLAVRWGFRTQDGRRLQVWDLRTPTRPLLPKARLGPRYQAARVAVSKAFRRLEHRGLARRGYSADAEDHRALGLVLTPAGEPVAYQALRRFRPQWQAAYEAMRRQREPVAGRR
jgi:hypothetical protein